MRDVFEGIGVIFVVCLALTVTLLSFKGGLRVDGLNHRLHELERRLDEAEKKCPCPLPVCPCPPGPPGALPAPRPIPPVEGVPCVQPSPCS